MINPNRCPECNEENELAATSFDSDTYTETRCCPKCGKRIFAIYTLNRVEDEYWREL